jgi:hypothetical protein
LSGQPRDHHQIKRTALADEHGRITQWAAEPVAAGSVDSNSALNPAATDILHPHNGIASRLCNNLIVKSTRNWIE